MTKITGRAKFYKEKDEWKMSVLGRNFFLNQCLTYLKKKDETMMQNRFASFHISDRFNDLFEELIHLRCSFFLS